MRSNRRWATGPDFLQNAGRGIPVDGSASGNTPHRHDELEQVETVDLHSAACCPCVKGATSDTGLILLMWLRQGGEWNR
jgi:hypothetical protein